MAYAFAEGAVTRLRREFKLLLPNLAAMRLCERLGAQCPSPMRTEITSVYFDRAGLPLTKRAVMTPEDCIKLRLKDYTPDVGSAEPRVVVECKREKGGLTQKLRAWVARKELRRLYESGELWGLLPFTDASGLRPVLAVSYLRDVYQLSEAWRVTVDKNVAFHRVDPIIALGPSPLRYAELPAAQAREERVVVEVKHMGEELPQWLGELRAGATVRFSKFAEGMSRVGSGEVVVVGGRG